MPRTFKPFPKPICSPSFFELCQSLKTILPGSPALVSRGDRPLKMTFEDQLNALIFFHLEEHVSARHLIQTLKEDDFARENGISRSSFSEAINITGLPTVFSNGYVPVRRKYFIIGFPKIRVTDGPLSITGGKDFHRPCAPK